MLGFVRTIRDYEHAAMLNIVSYEMHHEVYGTSTSTFDVEGLWQFEHAYLIINNVPMVITSCTPDANKGTTSIKGKPLLKQLFDRRIRYEERPGETPELRLVTDIMANYTNCPDAMYAYSYMSCIRPSTATTAAVEPEVDDLGHYNLYDYMERVHALSDVIITAVAGNYGITLNISTKADRHDYQYRHQIDCTAGQAAVISLTESNDTIAKVTNVTDEGVTDYYLLTDNSIVTTYTVRNRVNGKWVVKNNSKPEKIREDIQKSLASHAIVIECNRAMHYGDICTIKTPMGRIYTSTVTNVITTSKTTLIRYKLGSLAVTLVERMQQLEGG